MKTYLDPIAESINTQLVKIGDRLLDIYITNEKDMRKCPAPGCSGAGYIILKSCKDNLVCEICHHEWRDYE